MDILKKYKISVCLGLSTILILVQTLGNTYIEYKVHNNKVPKNINNYDVIQSYDNDNLLLVSNARGYYGMMTSNGREIISPIWNSIDVLSPNRFIVGRINDSASVSMGILDEYENITIPMLFNSISKVNDYFLIGTLSENNKKIVFNNSGNIELFQEWDDCIIDDNIATLRKDNSIAKVSADTNGNCTYISIDIPFNIFDNTFTVTIKNPITDGSSAFDDYSNVMNSVSKYCEAIFNSDTDMIRSTTNSQYYNSLISNMLPNCTLKDLSNISIYSRINPEVGIVYHVNFDLSYSSMATIIDNTNPLDYGAITEEPQEEITTIQLKMEFVRSDEGSIVLKSVEKVVPQDDTSTITDDYITTTTINDYYNNDYYY